METKKILEQVGLRPKQAAIYLALVEHGPQRITDICKYTQLHRPAVYKHLPYLTKMHLVSATPKGKQIFYTAESPEKLSVMIQALEGTLKTAMPELLSSFANFDKRPTVKFFEGRSGLTFIFDDIVHTLKKGDIYYRYSSIKDMKHSESYLPGDYRKIRDSKQLERFIITNKATASQKKPELERALKVVPDKYGLFDFDIMQIVYGNKIAYVDYNTETSLLIENPIIAEFQRKLFKILFDLLPGEVR